MNSAPVLGVGADIDIELHAAVGVTDVGVDEDVFEADVEGGVGVGGEGVAVFAGDVAGAAVVVGRLVEYLYHLGLGIAASCFVHSILLL